MRFTVEKRYPIEPEQCFSRRLQFMQTRAKIFRATSDLNNLKLLTDMEYKQGLSHLKDFMKFIIIICYYYFLRLVKICPESTSLNLYLSSETTGVRLPVCRSGIASTTWISTFASVPI